MRTLPGIGLTAFFGLGFDGWDDEMDINVRLISALVQGRALDKVAAEPGSPADGDIHILDETHATHPNNIAIRDNGAWVYIPPSSGWTMYDVAAGLERRFNGATWAPSITIDNDTTLGGDSATAVPSQHAVKSYIDAKVAGLSWKQAVRAATTAAKTLATDFENGDTIDGVVLATGNRVLVKNQATASENGIYVVNASGAPTRATDADSGAELVNATVYVSEGTVNADTQWTCSTNAPVTVGTTGLTFAQLTSGGGGLASGTSFPGSPSDGDRFLRTDRHIVYFYDATNTRWLSEQIFTLQPQIQDVGSTTPQTATGTLFINNPWCGTYNIVIERVVLNSRNTAATPASNYFTIQAFYEEGGSGTLLSTQNDAQNAWANRIQTPGSGLPAGGMLLTTSKAIFFTKTRVGVGSTDLLLNLHYRLVG